MEEKTLNLLGKSMKEKNQNEDEQDHYLIDEFLNHYRSLDEVSKKKYEKTKRWVSDFGEYRVKVADGEENFGKSENELKLLLKAQTKINAVEIKAKYENEEKYIRVIIMKEMKCDLNNYYDEKKGNKNFEEYMTEDYKKSIVVFFNTMLSILDGLYDLKICHSDIKPQNLLLNENDGLFLCDFGESYQIGPDIQIGEVMISGTMVCYDIFIY